MNLIQRIGLSSTAVDLPYALRALGLECNPTEFMLESNIESGKSGLPFALSLVAWHAYLSDETELARLHWAKLPEASLEYFYGEWRNARPEYSCRRTSPWMTLFEEAILACAVTGRWDRAYDLCAYPGDDCGVDHGRKAGERALLLALAAGMHAGTFADQTTAYLDACGEGTGRTKLEAELLKAAFEENRSALEIAFSKYLSFYQKKIFPATDITEKQCRWGTIIWHWMRERGYTIQTAEQWRDYLIRV